MSDLASVKSLAPEVAQTSTKGRVEPFGARPKRLSPGQIGLYAFLIIASAFFLLPIYVMFITSFKTLDDVRLGNIFSAPEIWTITPWIKAWSSACTGLECGGISIGFWNSVRILVPSVIASIFVGSLTGYALTFWRAKHANVLFAVILFGAFMPYQIFLYPLVRTFSFLSMNSSMLALVTAHVIFGLPVMTLVFRNFYASLPQEMFKAARIDGGRFFQIFFYLILPMSTPMIAVALILQVTGIWNDYVLGVVFGGLQNRPMTVQLINIVAPSGAEIEYNVNMAATILTALVPLLIYFVSGRWFVRGIAAGAIKG
jgi:glucose/mannose transport system permease protein